MALSREEECIFAKKASALKRQMEKMKKLKKLEWRGRRLPQNRVNRTRSL